MAYLKLFSLLPHFMEPLNMVPPFDGPWRAHLPLESWGFPGFGDLWDEFVAGSAKPKGSTRCVLDNLAQS